MDAVVDGRSRLPVATMTRVNPAFEISPDDPQEVADAIRRAAEGAVVHLVRDGRAVADIVPATAQPARALRDPRHIQISRMMAERFGATTRSRTPPEQHRGRGLRRVRCRQGPQCKRGRRLGRRPCRDADLARYRLGAAAQLLPAAFARSEAMLLHPSTESLIETLARV